MKGKVARLVAAKLSLAAKTDQYSDKDEGKEMREDLEKKVAELFESKKQGVQTI